MKPRRCLCAAFALALLVACGPGESAERDAPVAQLPEDGVRHVVLILVDQLRKDSADEWMPQTTALADQGVRFDAMRSTAPWTYPSVLSLFSGLYPQQHGADGNHKNNWLMTFDPEIELFHELLDEAGFDTAGFVTNPFLNPWNSFHEGFDHYDTSFIGDTGNLRGKPKLVWTNEMFADTVNPRVLEHYSARPLSAPEFTYVHYIDVHGPWDSAPFERDYESSVRWIDERIVELYDFFQERYGEDLLFVVTSDHGQSLGDDETVGEGKQFRRLKKTMHEFNLRIPFMVLPGAQVPAGVRLSEDATNVDALPTLLDWIGLGAERVATPGHSWLAQLRGEPASAPERPLYSRMSAFGWQTDALLQDTTKHVRRFEPGRSEVLDALSYELERDPRELTPRRDLHDAAAAEALRDAAETHGLVFRPTLHRPGSEAEAQLETLGYLGGDADSTVGDSEDG